MKTYKGLIDRFIKVIFITCACVFSFHPSYVLSQISEGGIPPSFIYQQMTRSMEEVENVPVNFYIKDLLETDNWQAQAGTPLRIAKNIQVDYNMDNSGQYTTLPGGENIWSFRLKANDAVAIMLYYKDFYIPEGGKLFIYSADKTHLLGAYTHKTHPLGGFFATEFVGGEELVLEYVASETSDEKPRIYIDEIGYGYNASALREFCGINSRKTKEDDCSDVDISCMVDVNCEEGDAWQNEKKSICWTIQKIGSYEYLCTASLLNNTAEDFKPLILTARHCAYDFNRRVFASDSDMKQWVFYFHREREGCGDDYPTTIPKTMTGCKMLVNTGTEGGSDGMLLLLNNMIPESYDVFYNGWDRRDVAATSGVCIHHPKGDYMKISTYSEKASTYTFESSEFNGNKNAHWNVLFKATTNGRSVTQCGSSGSPLYNENKLVVGTLTGGNSDCSYLRGLNIYGKMTYHWDKFKTDSSTRMDVWIDPLGKNYETFSGRFRKIFKPTPVNLKAVDIGQKISLTWGVPKGNETPKQYNIFRNNNKIGETTLLTYIDNNPIAGNLIYSVSAVYNDGEESPFGTTTLAYNIYEAPSGLTAKRVSEVNNDVKLSWKAPVYEQSIFWGTMIAGPFVGFKSKIPFYYGQKWSPEEISPLNEKTIKAVRFIPVENHIYKIFISQGSRIYRQDINPSSLNYSNMDKPEIDTVMLDKPFVIDGTKSLIVSIQISEIKGDIYPAVCDNGPVVDGKGNIYSYDGEEWFKLYDENKPNDFNYNFVLSAIISSERGTLTGINSSNVSTHSSEIIIRNSDINSRISEHSIFEKNKSAQVPVSIRNGVPVNGSMPAAFPEITSFRIYRCKNICTSYKDVSASETTFMENTSLDYSYVVTALYGDIESGYSNKADISPVDIEGINASFDLFPTRFSEFIYLRGYENVARVEIISLTGKVCHVVDKPNEAINTSSLAPGLYFFRLSDSNGRQKVIKAIKTNQ